MILDHLPADAEIGVGLALLTETDEYMFFLAGSRHVLESGEMFYAGIGGHLEPGESLLECGRREAREEIGAEIEYISHAGETLYLFSDKSSKIVPTDDTIKPLAVFEMIHPKGSPRSGQMYHIVIYQARLMTEPGDLKLDEVSGLITLNREQVLKGAERRATLQQIVEEGSTLILPDHVELDPTTKLYPIGTAEAMIQLVKHTELTFKWHGQADVEPNELNYSVLIAQFNNQFILIRNRNRTTWELPGGRREDGETIAQSASRELYEETGAVKFELTPIGVYSLNGSKGVAYYAEVTELGDLPDYEIAEIRLEDSLPEGLNYGNVYYELVARWNQEYDSDQSPD